MRRQQPRNGVGEMGSHFRHSPPTSPPGVVAPVGPPKSWARVGAEVPELAKPLTLPSESVQAHEVGGGGEGDTLLT